MIIHALIYDYRLLSFAAQAWFSSLACARVAFAKVTAAASVPACPSREGRRDVAMGGASSTMLLAQKKSSLAGRQNVKKRNRVCDADVCFEWYTDVAWVEQRVKRAPLDPFSIDTKLSAILPYLRGSAERVFAQVTPLPRFFFVWRVIIFCSLQKRCELSQLLFPAVKVKLEWR